MRSLILLAVLLSVTVVLAAETPLTIPSDVKAQYFVLDRGGTKAHPTLTTKRVGPSGISYSKRIFDCSVGTVKYLGSGDTLDEVKRSKPDPKMSPLVEGSIAWHQWRYACGQ